MTAVEQKYDLKKTMYGIHLISHYSSVMHFLLPMRAVKTSAITLIACFNLDKHNLGMK